MAVEGCCYEGQNHHAFRKKKYRSREGGGGGGGLRREELRLWEEGRGYNYKLGRRGQG